MQLSKNALKSKKDMYEKVHIKAELLASGVKLTSELYNNFGPPFLEKRRGYGNPDPLEIRNITIPQEIYFEGNEIISSINVRSQSNWILTFYNKKFVLQNIDGREIDVFFPLRPMFYDKSISNQQKVNQIITLYGGKSLAIFVYGTCSLVTIGKPCHYCSIDPNRSKSTDFEKVVKPFQLEEALEIALKNCPPEVNQIMLNGGNFPDLDRSFLYYVELARIARKVVDKLKKDIDLHLIVFPPNDLALIKKLKGINVSIAMNTEIFNPQLFEKYCPGKTKTLGQKNLFSSLVKAVEVLGEGKIYSILVGGLEPYDSTVEGLNFLANIGVTPIINVFHPDPETPLEKHSAPSAQEILKMGKSLQEVYQAHEYMRPFYFKCGRNSLDTEAYFGLFD